LGGWDWGGWDWGGWDWGAWDWGAWDWGVKGVLAFDRWLSTQLQQSKKAQLR